MTIQEISRQANIYQRFRRSCWSSENKETYYWFFNKNGRLLESDGETITFRHDLAADDWEFTS